MNRAEEIEIAAQRMLDAAGPEQMARFLASYDDDPQPPPLPPSAAHSQSAASPVTVDRVEVDESEPEQAVDFMGFIRPAVATRGEKMTEEEKSLVIRQCEDYLASAAFKQKYAAMTDASPLKRVTLALQRLDRRLRDRSLDFEHGIDLNELQELLTRNTEIRISIPMTKMRKGLDNPFVIETTLPLTTEKRHALAYFVDCLLNLAAIARILKSESEREFKEAYVLALGECGGPRASQEAIARPFEKKVAARLVEKFASAYKALFADGSVADRCREMGGEA